MPTKEELTQLQSLPLWQKICTTEYRLTDWVNCYGIDNVYISFSGGKDSTVLLDIARKLYPTIKGVFVNTGLEYPEIQSFVKSFDNIDIIRPKMSFIEVLKEYGYPVISKEVSECVANAKMHLSRGGGTTNITENCLELESMPQRVQKLLGILKQRSSPNKSKYNCKKYKPLLYAKFNISNKCCNVMKKNPAHEYSKMTGKMPITAQMAQESRLRQQQWLKNGCNGFDMKSPISNPMSFWTEQDVLQYIKENNLPIASVYGEVVEENGKLKTTGCQRTGCIFCAYALHNEKSPTRFERLKQTHPKQYNYCMNGGEYNEQGLWKPNKDGLGMKHIFDEMNEIFGEGFIKY